MRETRLNEAQPASDGSSKLNLIWSNEASYARGHPYTVLHPGTMHACTLLPLLCALTHSSIGFSVIWLHEVSPAARVWYRPESVWLQNSSIIGPMSWVGSSSTGCLIITLVDCRLFLRHGHVNVSANYLQISFAPRYLSRSGNFHARF